MRHSPRTGSSLRVPKVRSELRNGIVPLHPLARRNLTPPKSPTNPPVALIVTPRYLPLLGGLERECALLADEFSKLGYSPVVVTEQLGMSSPREEFVGKIKVIRIPSSENRSVIVQLKVAYSLAAILIRLRNDVAFSVVRTFTLPALVVGLLKRLRLIKFPTLVTAETGGDEDDIVALQRRPLSAVSRWIVESNDYLNGLCAANTDHLRQFGYSESKITSIPNGVDASRWESTHPPEQVRRFLFLGRIVATKGIFELIDAICALVSDHREITLTIAGAGPDENELRQRSSELGLEANVTFAGQVEYESLTDLFAAHDCLVLPSYSEGMPLSVLEAAAHHRVLVVTDVGDMRRLFDGRAFICPPRDVKALTESMRAAIDSATPKADYAAIIDEISIKKVADDLRTLLLNSQ